MNNQTTIGILGSGTWGIALARLLHRNGHDVTVWSKFPKEIENLSATRTHPALPGLVIPETVHFTCDLQTVASGKDILLFAVPSIAIRQTAESARPFIPDGQIIVDVAKGIEPDTLMTMTEVIRDELSKDGQHDHVKLVALSGPTHAEEVALDMPTSIVSACTDMQVAETVQDVFMNTCMRTYTNTDVLGVELCGAMKNIEALAVGISSGLGNGDNARAALITRGIAEISRKSWLFLILSGLATGASWLCYYRALQLGQASKVVPIDKLSVVITLILAWVFLHEQFNMKSLIGAALIAAGTLVMVL